MAEARVGLYVMMGVEDCWDVNIHVMVVDVIWRAGLVVVKLHWGIAVEWSTADDGLSGGTKDKLGIRRGGGIQLAMEFDGEQ